MRLLAMDEVELEFADDALEEIADEALKRNTGARGLRSIVEKVMLDVMYDVPSDPSIKKVIINAKCIRGEEKPQIIYKEQTA